MKIIGPTKTTVSYRLDPGETLANVPKKPPKIYKKCSRCKQLGVFEYT